MAEIPKTPQKIAEFKIEPAVSCPTCMSKIVSVRVDAVMDIAALTFKGNKLMTNVSLHNKQLTALPCGCLISTDTEETGT